MTALGIGNQAYFQSPLGYIFVGITFVWDVFFAYNLYGNTTDMRDIQHPVRRVCF